MEKWNKEKSVETYGRLGMDLHNSFFGMKSKLKRGEEQWKIQKQEILRLLRDSCNDVMVTGLDYDGHGRAKVAAYSVNETFSHMMKTGG